MSDNIRSDANMVYSLAGGTPWHKKGRQLTEDEKLDVLLTIKKAGLDFTVAVMAHRGDAVLNDGSIVHHSKTKTQSFYRTDTGEILGDVGLHTHPLQQVDAFMPFQKYLDAREATIETAGVLGGGERVWMLALLSRKPIVVGKNDEVVKYFLLSNPHDGSGAVNIGFTPIRVVCKNTEAMARESKASRFIRVNHSKRVKENVESVHDLVNMADAEFEATGEVYNALDRRGINAADLKKYVKTVFKFEPEDKDMSKQSARTLQAILDRHEQMTGTMQSLIEGFHAQQESQAKVEANLLETVLENFETDKGAGNASWWTAYNAISDHLTHTSGRSEDTRLNSLAFGEGSRKNYAALQVAQQMSGLKTA